MVPVPRTAGLGYSGPTGGKPATSVRYGNVAEEGRAIRGSELTAAYQPERTKAGDHQSGCKSYASALQQRSNAVREKAQRNQIWQSTETECRHRKGTVDRVA